MPHKLLLADDSVTIQRVIELTFAEEDIQVIAVGDGKQAIHRVQQDPPDIILADVGMPERDGYEVAMFVKQSPELKHIPVLLLTGAFEPIDEARARAAGCDGVLVKPFEPQLVINRVKDLINARRSQPQPVPQPRADQAVPPPASAQTSAPGAAPAGSIEDYFDRLDAAFSSLDTSAILGGPASTPGASKTAPVGDDRKSVFGDIGDPLADWDPDLGRDASAMRITTPPLDLGWTPAPHAAPPVASPEPPPVAPPATVAPPPTPAPVVEPPPVQALPPSFQHPATVPPAPPSLAEAFAALLTAEQGRPFSPAAAQQGPMDERAIEEVTRRVLDRMSDRVVKDTVVDLAERMVRDEINRIKSTAH